MPPALSPSPSRSPAPSRGATPPPEPGFLQSLYRRVGPIFSTNAAQYTAVATSSSERNNWEVEGRGSVDDTSVVVDGEGEDGVERRSGGRHSFADATEEEDAPHDRYRDGDGDSTDSSPGRTSPYLHHARHARHAQHGGTSLDLRRLERLAPETRGGDDGADDDDASDTALWEPWYLVTTAALLAFHREETVADVWRHVAAGLRGLPGGDGHALALAVAERIADACVKSAAFVGLPRAGAALACLGTAARALRKDSDERAPTGDTPTDAAAQGENMSPPPTGEAMPGAVDRLALASVSSDMAAHCSSRAATAITATYERLLYGPGGALAPAETAMVAFACCLADDMPAQAECFFHSCRRLGTTNAELGLVAHIVDEVSVGLGRGHCEGVRAAEAAFLPPRWRPQRTS